MASKGIVCLLALLYLVKSSHQHANEGLAVSSQRSGQPENGEEEDRSEAQASAQAQASTQSLMPGGFLNPWNDNDYNGAVLRCRYEDQVLNTFVNGECLVCVCVLRRNTRTVEPVCGSCNNCQYRPTLPPPPPTPTRPTTTPTPPPPPSVPKCDPLPPNVPFQNPLDPCQVCICIQSTDLYGNPQIPIIECQRNPECVPIPTPPHPEDTICSVYPINVWFKHPSKQCEICECTPEQQYNGQVRPVLVCLRDPECDVPPTTLLPPTTPFYPSSTELPTSRPPPPPRKSCYPFVPNVPFNHTWDPCQICVCTEEYYENTITIEIQCQARRDCCIEYYPSLDPSVVPVPLIPGQIVQPVYPHVLSGSSNAVAVSSAGAGQASSSANAGANSALYQGQNPNGANVNYNTQMYPGQAESNAGASSVLSPGQNPNVGYLFYPSGSESQSAANAGAVANVNNNPQAYPSQPGLLPTPNLFQTNANSYADASANTQTLLSPYGQGSQSQSAANAGAVANVNNNPQAYIGQPGLLPTPNLFQSNANSHADASANAQTLLSLYGQGSQSQSAANAGAVANVNNNPQTYLGQPGLLPTQNLFQPNANSHADASANAQTLLSLYGQGSQSQSTANAGASANTLEFKYPTQGGLIPGQSNLNSLNAINNPQLQYPGYARPQMGQNVADASANSAANAGMLQSFYGPGSQSQSEAEANANSFVSNLYGGSQAAAQADASANAGVLNSPLYQGQFGSQSLADASAVATSNVNSASYPYGPVLPQNAAEADASAIASANNGLSPYTLLGSAYGSGPNIPQMNTLSQTNAMAQANAQAQQNAMAQSNAQAQAQAILAQLQGDAMQNALVLPNPYGGGSSTQAQALAHGQYNANAQANSQALGGDSSQASAQAYAASKKSGEVEEGLQES